MSTRRNISLGALWSVAVVWSCEHMRVNVDWETCTHMDIFTRCCDIEKVFLYSFVLSKKLAACVYFCIFNARFPSPIPPPPFFHWIMVSDWNWSFACPLLERKDQICWSSFPTSSSLSFCSQCDSWGQAIPSWALWHCWTGKYLSDPIEPDKGCTEEEENVQLSVDLKINPA